MSYTKPATTIDQQILKLTDRGMIGDKAEMRRALERVGYYRLTPYWEPFRPHDDRSTFISGTDFSDVWDRYIFDRRLRLLLMDALERIEVSIRGELANRHALRYGPFGYVKSRVTSLPTGDEAKREYFADELFRNAKRAMKSERFVQHFCARYGSPNEVPLLPVWAASELMSFGTMVTFFKLCEKSLRKEVSERFGVPEAVFESWLLTLNMVRNFCAHHSRLWNRGIGLRPKLPRKHPAWTTGDPLRTDRIFVVLTICRWCLGQICPATHWDKRLEGLLNDYPEIPRNEMGMPNDYSKHPVWSA